MYRLYSNSLISSLYVYTNIQSGRGQTKTVHLPIRLFLTVHGNAQLVTFALCVYEFQNSRVQFHRITFRAKLIKLRQKFWVAFLGWGCSMSQGWVRNTHGHGGGFFYVLEVHTYRPKVSLCGQKVIFIPQIFGGAHVVRRPTNASFISLHKIDKLTWCLKTMVKIFTLIT